VVKIHNAFSLSQIDSGRKFITSLIPNYFPF